LFRAVERAFDLADWKEFDELLATLADPLFGEQIDRRFANLRRELATWDAADRADGPRSDW
jgi:hypothetical protein